MKLTKCVNGHFYDEEKFESCPHCAGGSKLDVNAIFGSTPSAPKPAMSKVERDDDVTVPLEWTPSEPAAPKTLAMDSASEVTPEAPAMEPVSEVTPEAPAAEPVSEVTPEAPAAEPASGVVPEAPAWEPASEGSPKASAMEPVSEEPAWEPVSEAAPAAAEETSDLSVDIQAQPSFDTPLDFDGEFAGGVKAAEEVSGIEEPEDFELLSKFDTNPADSEESEVTVESEPFVLPESETVTPESVAGPEPFVVPEPTAEPEPFVAPEPAAEPEPFAAPLEPTAEPEPFVAPQPTAEPEPFVAPQPTAGPEPFAAPESTADSGLFVAPGAAKAEWEVSQPDVEEISTGDQVSGVIDPELEDRPTEIVDETDLANEMKAEPSPFVPLEPSAASIPEPGLSAEASPAAAMYGASADDDDDEHTVAFYDEIFVSKAPAAPVVPDAAAQMPDSPGVSAASIPGAAPVAEAAPTSETVAGTSENMPGAPELDVFTAPPLQPAQALPTPCVGWLIALNGSHIGQDFHLRVGKNYIGRDVGMDIALTGDKSVSRNKHAIIIYEPKHHKYYIQPGESNELVYVNDEVVLLPMPLKPYDTIVIGDIELWFMPLCDDQHNWSEVIRRLQEQM